MTMLGGITSRAPPKCPAYEKSLTDPQPIVAGLTLSFCTDPARIARQWLAFETKAQATLFQSYKWISAWCRTAAMAYGEQPLILTGHDADGRLALIWPMAIIRSSGTCVLTWLGQTFSNYNCGLYRRDIVDQIGRPEILAILGQITRSWPEIDAIRFLHQPYEWNGIINPLARLPSIPAPYRYYALDLLPDFDSLYASKFSSRSRSKLRRYERRLAEKGHLKIAIAEKEVQRLDLFETFLRQKSVQLTDKGEPNAFADMRTQIFYRELMCDLGDGPPLEFSYIGIDESVLATFNGMQFQNRFYFLNTSMGLGELQRWSPGFFLLREHVANHCRRRTPVFDFGPGEFRYKTDWEPCEFPLFETYLSLRPRALATTLISRAKARSKLIIKHNPILWKTAHSARRVSRTLFRLAPKISGIFRQWP